MADRLRKLAVFTWQQAMSCLFPVIIFAALAVTKAVEVPGIARYDLLLVICIVTQIVMLATRLETKDEMLVIACFHVIGIALELFKVHMGSWMYPGDGWSKLFGVPLYAGFMYASVASYICQAWRRFDLRLVKWPDARLTVALCTAVYANFFTLHYWFDVRWLLIAAILAVFFRTWVVYRVDGRDYRMPMSLSFVLIAFFIWIAENVGTLLGAWRYPNQEQAWELVHWGKLSSWFLLVIISVLIVAELKRVKSGLGGKRIFPAEHTAQRDSG